METPFIRTQMLIGEENYNKLKNSNVAVFGVGGVGGFVCEALVRSGIGKISVFDNDCVSISNLNRQIIADTSSIGQSKVDVIKKRLLQINPQLEVSAFNMFYTSDNADQVSLEAYDYIVDAIDTVSSKLTLIKLAKQYNIPIISCMGTGGKLDITKLKISDIKKTSGCPLARVMRRELKKLEIESLKVVYSDEQATYNVCNAQENNQLKADGKKAPPSMIFVPASAGLLLASQVINDLINK